MSDLPQAPVTNQPPNVTFYISDGFWASVHLSPAFLVSLLVLALGLLGWHLFRHQVFTKHMEIDEAEIGIGNQKLKLKPNEVDRQIAYQVWVELSTRKIGLAIDPEHDVVSEVYDSWYSFFSVTRELIKDLPVTKVTRENTEQIIRLSIEVLNNGIRPHLTRWQARFRRWYEAQLALAANADEDPQDIQRHFPQFEELIADMLLVNERLIRYRNQMYKVATGKDSDPLQPARSEAEQSTQSSR